MSRVRGQQSCRNDRGSFGFKLQNTAGNRDATIKMVSTSTGQVIERRSRRFVVVQTWTPALAGRGPPPRVTWLVEAGPVVRNGCRPTFQSRSTQSTSGPRSDIPTRPAVQQIATAAGRSAPRRGPDVIRAADWW
jgi:hypothetical protein